MKKQLRSKNKTKIYIAKRKYTKKKHNVLKNILKDKNPGINMVNRKRFQVIISNVTHNYIKTEAKKNKMKLGRYIEKMCVDISRYKLLEDSLKQQNQIKDRHIDSSYVPPPKFIAPLDKPSFWKRLFSGDN